MDLRKVFRLDADLDEVGLDLGFEDLCQRLEDARDSDRLHTLSRDDLETYVMLLSYELDDLYRRRFKKK